MPDYTLLSLVFRAPFGPLSERHPSELTPLSSFILEILRRILLPTTENRDGITTIQQWLLAYIIHQQQFDIVDFLLCGIDDVIADSIKMGLLLPYGHIISYILVGSMGRHAREPGTDLLMDSLEEWSSLATTMDSGP